MPSPWYDSFRMSKTIQSARNRTAAEMFKILTIRMGAKLMIYDI